MLEIDLRRYLNRAGKFPSCGDRAWNRLKSQGQSGPNIRVACNSVNTGNECKGCLYNSGVISIDLRDPYANEPVEERGESDQERGWDNAQNPPD